MVLFFRWLFFFWHTEENMFYLSGKKQAYLVKINDVIMFCYKIYVRPVLGIAVQYITLLVIQHPVGMASSIQIPTHEFEKEPVLNFALA